MRVDNADDECERDASLAYHTLMMHRNIALSLRSRVQSKYSKTNAENTIFFISSRSRRGRWWRSSVY